MFLRRLLCVLLIVIAAPGLAGSSDTGGDLDRALVSITPGDLKAHIQTLSSDEFEGRAPATRGEKKTLRYLQEKFAELGLRPGNGESFIQEIALTEITSRPTGNLVVRDGNGEIRCAFGGEFVALSRHTDEHVRIDGSNVIFVGYGIVAPEYGWNDYAGIDVRGKTVVMLVNDPGFATKDSTLFDGDAMTYYGRWTYKYEEASRQGAAGAFIVHETEPAAYPWAVVQNSFTGPQMYFTAEGGNRSRCAVEGWLTVDAARAIFRHAGLVFDDAKTAAARRNFSAIPLGLEASIILENEIREAVSSNVLALLPGAGRADECIVYMAHWDHLGIDASLTDDPIFNGALDNASGVSCLLELAEAFTRLETRLPRSILFIAVTCEEQGLLGSEYYADHPVLPLDRTVAAINMDAMNIMGPMKDITVIGYGNSELDEYLSDAAATQGRIVNPDPEPAKGAFFRSDHFSLAKRGVPVLYIGSGTDHVVHGPEWTREQRDRYIAERYHKPADEYDPQWDLSGMVDDIRLLCIVGYRLAGETGFPKWKEDATFKAPRHE